MAGFSLEITSASTCFATWDETGAASDSSLGVFRASLSRLTGPWTSSLHTRAGSARRLRDSHLRQFPVAYASRSWRPSRSTSPCWSSGSEGMTRRAHTCHCLALWISPETTASCHCLLQLPGIHMSLPGLRASLRLCKTAFTRRSARDAGIHSSLSDGDLIEVSSLPWSTVVLSASLQTRVEHTLVTVWLRGLIEITPAPLFLGVELRPARYTLVNAERCTTHRVKVHFQARTDVSHWHISVPVVFR